MSGRGFKAGVVVSVLVLTGCGSGGGVTAAPAGNPTASSPSTVQPASDPSTATPTPKVTSTPSDSLGAESDFCRGVLSDGRPALKALKKLVNHPDGEGLTAADFSGPRDKLLKRQQTAPKHLLGYVKTQVAVLDEVLPDVTKVKHSTKLANRFSDARVNMTLDCEMAE